METVSPALSWHHLFLYFAFLTLFLPSAIHRANHIFQSHGSPSLCWSIPFATGPHCLVIVLVKVCLPELNMLLLKLHPSLVSKELKQDFLQLMMRTGTFHKCHLLQPEARTVGARVPTPQGCCMSSTSL